MTYICETWLVWWGNVSCSIIISCCWTRTDILIFFVHYERQMSECACQFIFSNSHMTTHQIKQCIKQNLNLKAHPFLHILIYYKHIFILNFFEHLKNIYREYIQKYQNHKNCWELSVILHLDKGAWITLKIHMLCFVLINSFLLNLLFIFL